MRRIAVLLLASLIVVSGATASPRSDGLVSKAVQALGGESALASVKTVAVKGSIRQWEPEQSVNPGGEMRLANDSTFEIVVDYGARASRTDWVKVNVPVAADRLTIPADVKASASKPA